MAFLWDFLLGQLKQEALRLGAAALTTERRPTSGSLLRSRCYWVGSGDPAD